MAVYIDEIEGRKKLFKNHRKKRKKTLLGFFLEKRVFFSNPGSVPIFNTFTDSGADATQVSMLVQRRVSSPTDHLRFPHPRAPGRQPPPPPQSKAVRK